MRSLFPATAGALCLFIAAAARLQSAQLDPAFDVGTGPNGNVLTIVPLTNGTILVGGEFSRWNGQPRGSVVRLNADGTRDRTFEAELQKPVRQLFVQHGGVLAVGIDSIVRLLPDGVLDSDFQPLTVTGPVAATEDYLYTVFVPPRPRPILEVRSPDGLLINTVYTGSVGDQAYRLIPFTQNRVFMLGQFYIGPMPLLGPTGQAPNFPGLGGGFAWNAAVAPDGAFYEAAVYLSQLRVRRLDANGQMDTNFAEVTASGQEFDNMAVQNDGRLLYGSDTVMRLNLDGSVDATFAPNFAGTTIRAIAVQPDGNVLVGGAIGSVNGRAQPNLVRLLATASGPEGFTISGRVTDGTNGIAGVRVRTSRNNSTFTDETGSYTLTVSKKGIYVVRPSFERTRFAPLYGRARVRDDVLLPDFVVRRRR